MNAVTMTGGCLCGAVTYEFELPTKFVGYCHCTMCQRAHGAGFVAWIGAREDTFRITASEDALVHYRSSDHVTRSFCGRCGSPMLCNGDNHENVIDIALASVHGDVGREPQAHYYYDCRANWTKVNDDLPKLGGDDGVSSLKI
jgi:hypothetical protein